MNKSEGRLRSCHKVIRFTHGGIHTFAFYSSALPRNVAVKMLQPIDPGGNARESTLAAYRAGKSKWERDPLQYACKAYCTARQELNILIHLRHPHIVPLVGICTNPLSIVLELAPMGALDQRLKHYRR